MITRNTQSVFDEGFIDAALKRNSTSLFIEAVIFDHISRGSDKAIKEFCDSPEAKDMIAAGVISQNVVERLRGVPDCRATEFAACQTACDQEDPLWQQLVGARREERRIMNDLMEKYGGAVDSVSNRVKQEIIDKKIPTRFVFNER